MQPVFSFKLRGAYNKLKRLVDSGNYPDAGVVACSAGNHAQGVAFSANELNVKATIVMPLATPKIKVNSVKALGGANVDVRLFGNNFDFAAEEAQRLVNEEKMAMIHPFDDRDVISGQGMYCSFYNLPSITNQTTRTFQVRSVWRLLKLPRGEIWMQYLFAVEVEECLPVLLRTSRACVRMFA